MAYTASEEVPSKGQFVKTYLHFVIMKVKKDLLYALYLWRTASEQDLYVLINFFNSPVLKLIKSLMEVNLKFRLQWRKAIFKLVSVHSE